MASLGSVTSTALTGGDAPVFEGVAKEVQAGVEAGVEAANKSSNAQVTAMSKEVAELKDLITELLAAQKVNATVAEVDEAPADKVAEPKEPVLNDTAGVTKAKAK